MTPVVTGTGPNGTGPQEEAAPSSTFTASTIPVDADVLLQMSDERDRYTERIIAAEKSGYERGYRDGAADAAVFAAEMASDEEAERHWRDSVRNLNLDRRDEALVARLKTKLARYRETRDPQYRLDHHEHLILFSSANPGVRFDPDPHLQPHGCSRKPRPPMDPDEADRSVARLDAFLAERTSR